jgi:hypothetical protein
LPWGLHLWKMRSMETTLNGPANVCIGSADCPEVCTCERWGRWKRRQMALHMYAMRRVGQNHIYTWCMYSIVCRDSIKHTFIDVRRSTCFWGHESSPCSVVPCRCVKPHVWHSWFARDSVVGWPKPCIIHVYVYT